MRRGTTPTLTIQTDMDLSEFKVYVTLSQGAVQKDFVPSVSEKEVTIELTQEDTLAFEKGNAKLQIRAVDEGGHAIASNVMTVNITEILKEGIISYDNN